MSRRDPRVSLQQMRDHAREALSLIAGRAREDLDSDRMLNLSLVRLLEIVGEAAGRVPPQERAKHPQIPWSDIIGLRNRLVHGYDRVDLDVVWEIVNQDLPGLVNALDGVIPPAGM